MLENRDYMRAGSASGNPLGFPWSASVGIMILLVATFALQCINDTYGRPAIENSLALTRAAFVRGHVWQFLTFQFLHNGLWHLAGNLMGLWFFGRWVEQILGTKRFLVAYLGCGVAGGLFQGLLMMSSDYFGSVVLGASAGVMGIFAIFARLESATELRLNFILPIRAGTLLWLSFAISLFFTLFPNRGGGVAHAAHLGGLLGGMLWVKLGWHLDYVILPWEKLRTLFRSRGSVPARPRKAEMAHATTRPARSQTNAGAKPTSVVAPEEFISREVDPILDKISAHGMQSLTERERKTLTDAQKKMTKP